MIRRLLFALRHRTFRKAAVAPGDPAHVDVYHHGSTVTLRRRCPHQGARLEEGWVEGDELVCPWHGCRFPLKKGSEKT